MASIDDVISSDEQANVQEVSQTSAEELAKIKQRSVRGAIAYGARTLLLQGIAFGANLALGAFLGVEEYAVYFVVTALIGIFTFLSDIGLAASLVQKKTAPTIAELRTTFTVQQTLSTVIFLLIAALTPYWQHTQHLDAKELALLYALAASFWLSSLKTIPSILLERRLLFDRLVIPAMIENLVFYGIAVWLAWRGYGISSFTYAVWLRSILGVIAMYAIQRWPIGFALDIAALKHLMKFGAKFQLNDLLARIKDDLFIFFLGSWLGESVGYVGWAKRWSMFPYQLSVNSVMAVTFPTFSRIQDDKERLAKAIEKSLYFITLVIFPLLAGMSVFMFPLVSLIQEYGKWQPALWSLVFFAISVGWAAVSTPLTNTLNAIGQIDKTLKLMVLWTVLTWTVTPLCVWVWGFTGVSIAAVIISSTSLLTFVMVKKVVPIKIWAMIWKQLVASLVMGAVGIAGITIWDNSFLHFFVGGFLAGLIYLGTFLLIGWKQLQSELRSIGILK